MDSGVLNFVVIVSFLFVLIFDVVVLLIIIESVWVGGGVLKLRILMVVNIILL